MKRQLGGVAVALALVALSGCNGRDDGDSGVEPASSQASTAAVAASDQPATASEQAFAEDCGLEKAIAFVGRTDNAALRKAVTHAVGARPIRWIRPGDAVTQDYGPNRLNVMLDENGRIASVRCG